MKFYKLELINREDSYNKMFGTNPNVGVLNPLATKGQNGKAMQMAPMGAPMGMAMGIGGMGMGGKGMQAPIVATPGAGLMT
jgi:hypothetical protein